MPRKVTGHKASNANLTENSHKVEDSKTTLMCVGSHHRCSKSLWQVARHLTNLGKLCSRISDICKGRLDGDGDLLDLDLPMQVSSLLHGSQARYSSYSRRARPRCGYTITTIIPESLEYTHDHGSTVISTSHGVVCYHFPYCKHKPAEMAVYIQSFITAELATKYCQVELVVWPQCCDHSAVATQ